MSLHQPIANEKFQSSRPIYMDCNATTPIEPIVLESIYQWYQEECGNSGSRTHEYGVRAKRAVQKARQQIANLVNCDQDEVIFTSGATESNNIAILGLRKFANSTNRKHIITSEIEHKAVLEPFEELKSDGFAVSYIATKKDGTINLDHLNEIIRPDTLLVSVMHVNNETGMVQPISKIAEILDEQDTYFHVDAAQGFGKEYELLTNTRLDMISVSSHKIFGPAGVGALILRKREFKRPKLSSLTFGGGQENRIRPGTLPVPLLVGFGVAAKSAQENASERHKICESIRTEFLNSIKPLDININGDPNLSLPHVVNFYIKGLDSEALMLSLKDELAISNGSACTSQSYEPSHVLKSMGLEDSQIAGSVRFSWCHLTPKVNWNEIVSKISSVST